MGAAAGMLAAPAARAAGALETRSVEIAGVRDPQLGAQMAIASQYGYFKDAGLDVTIHWNQSAADTLTTMASGINVGVGGIFTQVVFSGQNLPIRTISALADIAETQGFALGPNVKLASPKELEGKKLAYTQGNSQILLIAKLADMYKFDMAKITLVNMNQSEGIVAASKGDVVGLLGWQPNLYRLIAMGGQHVCDGHPALRHRHGADAALRRPATIQPLGTARQPGLDRHQAEHPRRAAERTEAGDRPADHRPARARWRRCRPCCGSTATRSRSWPRRTNTALASPTPWRAA